MIVAQNGTPEKFTTRLATDEAVFGFPCYEGFIIHHSDGTAEFKGWKAHFANTLDEAREWVQE